MKLNIVGEIIAVVKVPIRILILLINSNKAMVVEEQSNQIANKINPISKSILLNIILRLSGTRCA